MSTPTTTAELDQLCINTMRFLSVDAVQKADSGHPGLPLGAAPMAYVLWTRFLKHNPSDPHWFNRDRFILSAGHGSMLLYSLLHLTGYDIPMEQIKLFRQWGSITPGHPERGLVPGVEVTTGPLGQGFANGVGIAMAEAYLAAQYNKPGSTIIDHYTYALVSDGDLMEGVAAEAASLAGHLKLGKLIYLYDDNRITLASATPVTFTENHEERFRSYGWHTQIVADGNDLGAIDSAIRAAQADTERPSIILIRTHIGYGSPNKQDTCAAHGSPLGEDEVKLTKQHLGWPVEPSFLVPEAAQTHFRTAVNVGSKLSAAWEAQFISYKEKYQESAQELDALIHGHIPIDWAKNIAPFPADVKGIATRAASGKVMQAFYPLLPGFIGGSADLNPSTFTELKDAGNFENPAMAIGDMQGSATGGWSYAGRNVQYGVREHAMGSISNGLAAHGGLIPFCATFLTFSDYMRPPMRLAALMELKVIYVFTHDSIAMGEDGPTHQPVEHLAALRAIPELIMIRPADANETIAAWHMAVEIPKKPVALVLSRQNVPTLDRQQYAPADHLRFGAYILADAPQGNPELILIATGSEVSLIVAAQEKLKAQNIAVRIVSMPSWELFDAQTPEYRDNIIPANVPARIAVEAGISQGWHRYTGDSGEVISIDRFGASAPGPVMLREFGFTVDHICERALALLKKTSPVYEKTGGL
ncbi:transketolase [Chitinophaga niastensis]|uniref:Transketolase n=1 Tax=Chitinophaga niastensis TaxID=536980 RepID=A0A2P8HB82_CHINA|nr:transketolase [Chitinophaga niastensis]PSL43483.1 transketolase [Chitinophaga niastensis]